MSKTATGYFFEEYAVGQVFAHATPRTVTSGDVAFYTALYPQRFALFTSEMFASACGLPRAPLDPLIVFHTVFGKSVPDISRNAVANLGYAEGRILAPVFPGETLSATSEVIGLKETSSGRTGIVWVRTKGFSDGRPVLEFCRWVMVRKRTVDAPAPEAVVPSLAPAVAATDLVLPPGLDFTVHNDVEAGSRHRWGDYAPGEIIDHIDGTTLEEAEHMLATRLWQNTARVHFDAMHRPEGRLIYGGHIISLARGLAFNGLEAAHWVAAINAGAHANPAMAGDTVFAWTEVLDTAETARPDIGALRLRLVAAKEPKADAPLKDERGKHAPHILLDFDHWVLMPT